MRLTPVATRIEDFLHSRTRWAIVSVVVVFLVGTFLKLYADTWLSDNVVTPTVAWVQKAASVSMGVGLLGLLSVVVILLLVAFIDTSPNAAVLARHLTRKGEKEAKPAPLSAEDRIEVERIRELWNVEEVKAASDFLASILDDAATHFNKEGNPFAYLLRDPTLRLRTSHKAVDEALSEKPQNLSRIQNLLVQFGQKYGAGACRVNRIRFVDPAFPDEKSAIRDLAGWRRSHSAVTNMFSILSKREAFEHVDIGGLDSDADSVVFKNESDFREYVVTSRARVVGERLALITDDEKAFLTLFCVERLPMSKAALLPNEVYSAGETLVSEKILNSSEIRPGVFRFCLPREARRVWPIPGGFMKECIEIDLATVKASGASGSGAGAGSQLAQLGKALDIAGF